jgi:hypothetical protein
MQNLLIKYTPSHIYNNLNSNGENTAFVHLSEVFLINDASLKEREPTVRKVSTSDGSPVFQAKWCKGNGKTFLVIGLKNGVQVITRQRYGSNFDQRFTILMVPKCCIPPLSQPTMRWV